MDKREKILKAAIDVFFQKSFYDATMEDIAEASGVKKSTIYYYYTSKMDLVFELLKDSINILFTNLEEILKNTEEAKDKVKSIIDFYIKMYKKNYKLFIVFQRIGYDFMKSKDEKARINEFFENLRKEKKKLTSLFGDVTLSSGKTLNGEVFVGALMGALGRVIFEHISQGKDPKEKELRDIGEIFIAALK